MWLTAAIDMIDAKGSSRHPLGQLAYRIISGNVWYDARIVLEDQKVSVLLNNHLIKVTPTRNLDWALPSSSPSRRDWGPDHRKYDSSPYQLRRYALGHCI